MKKGVINMEKKNNWLNILKKLLIATGIVVIISVIATIGIGNYFVNYAILRTGNGGIGRIHDHAVSGIDAHMRDVHVSSVWFVAPEHKVPRLQ